MQPLEKSLLHLGLLLRNEITAKQPQPAGVLGCTIAEGVAHPTAPQLRSARGSYRSEARKR